MPGFRQGSDSMPWRSYPVYKVLFLACMSNYCMDALSCVINVLSSLERIHVRKRHRDSLESYSRMEVCLTGTWVAGNCARPMTRFMDCNGMLIMSPLPLSFTPDT